MRHTETPQGAADSPNAPNVPTRAESTTDIAVVLPCSDPPQPPFGVHHPLGLLIKQQQQQRQQHRHGRCLLPRRRQLPQVTPLQLLLRQHPWSQLLAWRAQ